MSENYCEAYIEDGIFHVILTYEDYTEEMADSIIKQANLIAKDQSYPFHIDLSKVKSYSRGARNRGTQEDVGRIAKVVAILVHSKLQEVLYNFFKVMHKESAPSQMFTNKNKAIEWLKQYR